MRRKIELSEGELEFLSTHRALPRKELHAKFLGQFGRRDVSVTQLSTICKKNRFMTGRGDRITRAGNGTHFAITEYTSHQGYVMMSDPDGVFDETPKYIKKHRRLWEGVNGPIPDGFILKCVSQDKSNAEPSNWRMIRKGVVGHLAFRDFDQSPAELKSVILATSVLAHSANALKPKCKPGSKKAT